MLPRQLVNDLSPPDDPRYFICHAVCPRGAPPAPPRPGPRAQDQINLTDPDSRILPAAGGGFEQSYNAQAAVDTDTMLVVATGLTQAANDKQQIAPMVETLCALPEELGEVSELLTDAGYYSEANVATCVEAGIDPLIATAASRITCLGKNASENRRRSAKRPTRWNACGIGKRPAPGARRMGSASRPWRRSSASSRRGCVSGNFCCGGLKPYAESGRW